MERGNYSLGAKREMPREVIPDLKGVYYRGRFWAATAWSRIGKGQVAAASSKAEPDGIGKPEAATPRRRNREGLSPVV